MGEPKRVSKKKGSFLDFEQSPFEHDEVLPSHADEQRDNTEEHMTTIFLVITASNIWSIVLITIPVLMNVGPNNLYYKHKYVYLTSLLMKNHLIISFV
jgi:hypothetical protein